MGFGEGEEGEGLRMGGQRGVVLGEEVEGPEVGSRGFDRICGVECGLSRQGEGGEGEELPSESVRPKVEELSSETRYCSTSSPIISRLEGSE